MELTHVVYRCFDTGGELLYVGYTSDWRRRCWNHIAASPWWPEVERVSFSQPMTHEQAIAHEADLIQRTRPLRNVQHNPVIVGEHKHIDGHAISRSTYVHHGCRCSSCRAANARYLRRRYNRLAVA